METSGSSAGKDSLGKETCWMAANTENSPRERRQRRRKLGAWLGEDGWLQEKVVRGAGCGMGRGRSWGAGGDAGRRAGPAEKNKYVQKTGGEEPERDKKMQSGRRRGRGQRKKKKVLKVTARGLAQPSVLPDGDR